MGSVEKLVKALDALKVAAEAAATEEGGGGGGNSGSGVGGMGSGVVSGLLGAATRKKEAGILTRREKVHHCHVIVDHLTATTTK